MTNANGSIDKTNRALEALLAAAFRLDISDEITDEEAEKLFQQPTRLSKEDQETINSWGTDFIDKLVEGHKTVTGKHQHNIINEELNREAFAMNRDTEGDGLDEEAQRKIDEERKKAIEEEYNKNEHEDDES